VTETKTATATDYYFAYGSNMSGPRLRARIGEVESLGAASIEGWRLVFNVASRDGSGKANLEPSADAIAWGVVWRIGSERWATLDGFEPGYQRRLVSVRTLARGTIEAGVYLSYYASSATQGEIAPFDWYVDHLIDGAREHALPEAWLEMLRSVRERAGTTPPA